MRTRTFLWLSHLQVSKKKVISYVSELKFFWAMKRIIPDKRHNSSFEKNLREKQN